MIAKTASEVGDIRFSFHVLLTAALLADRTKRQTITATT
jgi:Cdc6-like AAA superfamily ATPase